MAVDAPLLANDAAAAAARVRSDSSGPALALLVTRALVSAALLTGLAAGGAITRVTEIAVEHHL